MKNFLSITMLVAVLASIGVAQSAVTSISSFGSQSMIANPANPGSSSPLNLAARFLDTEVPATSNLQLALSGIPAVFGDGFGGTNPQIPSILSVGINFAPAMVFPSPGFDNPLFIDPASFFATPALGLTAAAGPGAVVNVSKGAPVLSTIEELGPNFQTPSLGFGYGNLEFCGSIIPPGLTITFQAIFVQGDGAFTSFTIYTSNAIQVTS